ncbi:E3 ubiquitin-protein ligase ZFP91 [Gadus chalcogrammus]|uniref:E3 ubiquitin-protein ligase ZFP91 n=1 Tax=Gadus chalcogrammus TaxID=1042646 RepID=UPI0024C28181|nr:E3 ubiquitin-protein ligase ZFP91 [Gadus chalcogrammus]XP_056441978.1 E3 ubiquitin-protein ligase ZFP91 [Gadus chalcogrammus]
MQMESKSGQNEDENKWEESEEQKAADQTPTTSTSVSPRRGLRARKVGRPKSGVPDSSDTNGAEPSPRSSGRVLRDRSTRSVPAWLKDTKSDEEDEPTPLLSATKRRKVSYSRRKKPTESAGCSEQAGEVGGDSTSTKDLENLDNPATNVHVSPTRGPAAQSRGKTSSARAAKGSARPICKSEPGTETLAVTERQVKGKEKGTTAIQKKEEAEEDEVNEEDVPGEKGLLFEDQPSDGNYQPQAQSEEVEEQVGGLSSDEDPPFRDDLNDQSYNPKPEREALKPKRRAPPKPKEKKDVPTLPSTAGEAADVKVEGSEYMEPLEEDVKTEEEAREDPEGPRKRGRRRKDDKTPRLPKRRKKPPVQYVRCEIEGCGTVLAHPRYLQHHIKYQHLLKKKYVCPHPSCGRLFRLQKQLLRHAKHHTDQRDYICEFCARAFKSSHNLAVHRMIHTGEKPLQCEICGFTCRQKASLNWHMKKHDADATYQFSCSICGKKFEKKDCVVAHKAKSHPEVLIAEALAANAGALITTPASMLELQGAQARPAQPEAAGLEAAPAPGQHHVGHQVVLLGQDHQSLHTMQVPVTIALSPADPPSPDGRQQQQHLQLQMPLHFVQTSGLHGQQQQQPQIQQLTLTHSGAVVSQPQIQQLTLHSGSVVTQHQGQLLQPQQQQQQQLGHTEVLHMTFQPVGQTQGHLQQIPLQLQALQTAPVAQGDAQHQGIVANGDGYVLDTSVLSSSTSSALGQQGPAVVWEQTAEGLADGGVQALL